MTVSSTERTAGPFVGNGSQTDFPFTFRVFVDTDIVAAQTDTDGIVTTLDLGSDYTVAVNANQRDNPGGTLTMLSALPSGYQLDLTTSLQATQGLRLTTAGGFFPDAIENALDKLTILLQQLGINVTQLLRVPFPEILSQLPSASERLGKILRFNDTTGDAELAVSIGSTVLSQSVIGYLLYPRTAGEIAAGVVPTYYYYKPGDVRRYGASDLTDGVADDTAAIRDAIAVAKAAGYGGEVQFAKVHRITSTIEESDLRGVKFAGEMWTINTLDDDALNTRIFWDGANSTDPMFYFRRGHGVEFHRLTLDGKKTTGSAHRAYVGVWMDEHHLDYKFYGCKFMRMAIGRRHCSGYNYDTTAWTPGVSAYDGASNAPATTAGGYQSDNAYGENCVYDCTIAGISIESAQALAMVEVKPQFFSYNVPRYAVAIPSCQGLHLISPTFLGASAAEVWTPTTATSNIGGIKISNPHQEGGAGVLLSATYAGQNWVGMVIEGGGGGSVDFGGASGTLTVWNSILSKVAVKTANVSVSLEDTTLTTFDKTAALGNGPLLKIVNSTITNMTNNWNAFQTVSINASTCGGYTARSHLAAFMSNGLGSSLLLGPTDSASTTQMDGTSFFADANQLVIGVNCYLTTAGAFVATQTAGAKLTIHKATGMAYATFSGATIGAAPAFTDRAIFDPSGGVALLTLPTSSPGAGTKKLWNNAGVVNIAT